MNRAFSITLLISSMAHGLILLSSETDTLWQHDSASATGTASFIVSLSKPIKPIALPPPPSPAQALAKQPIATLTPSPTPATNKTSIKTQQVATPSPSTQTPTPPTQSQPTAANSVPAVANVSHDMIDYLTSQFKMHFRYPYIARRQGWDGTVIVDLDITANGRIVAIGIQQSSGYHVLDNNAVATFRAIGTLSPALQAKLKQAQTVSVPVVYQLTGG